MKKFILLLSAFYFSATFSQTSKEEIGPSAFEVQLIPASPGVANLGKYGKDPINEYNGTANINIPLYDLAFEGISIPLSLGYNTGGVKVNEDASWVGLGWSFLENIVITREINGYDDLRNYELNSGGMHDAESKGWIFTEDLFTFIGHPDYYYEIVEEDLDILANQMRTNKPYDSEPDLFTLTVPTGTVKFYLPRILNGETVLQAKVVTEPNFNVKYNVETLTFEVKDPEGFTYIFDKKEYSTGYSSWDAPDATNEQHALNGIPHWSTNQTRKLNSSWKVSKIISYSGRELNFEYENGFYFSFPHFREKFGFSIGGNTGPGNSNEYIGDISAPNISASLTAFHTLYLSSVWGDFGSISFQLGERADLFSKEAKATMANELIWNPAIEPNVNRDKKLERVQVKNQNGHLVQDVTFNYSYFNNYAANSSLPERFLRLKLDSISLFDKTFTFNYIDPEKLPAKDSKSVDLWGFFNGIENTKRIPTSNRFYLVLPSNSPSYQMFETFYKWKGAVRKSDFNYGKIGNLSKITYPTGGFTNYSYEGNTVVLNTPSYSAQFFSNQDFRSSQVNSSEAYNFRYQYLKLANDPSYSFFGNSNCSLESSGRIGNNQNFSLNSSNLCNGQNYNLKIQATLSCNTGCGQGIDPKGKAVWLENIDTGAEIVVFEYDYQFNQTYDPVYLEQTLNLAPGNYVLKSSNWSINDPFLVVASSSTSAISWGNNSNPDILPDYVEEFEVGGVRISEITHHEKDGTVLNSHIFSYNKLFDDGTYRSSGKLMDDLIFTSKGKSFQEYTPEGYSEGSGGENKAFVHSDNLIRISNSAAGSHIGYDQVTLKSVNSEMESNGKIISRFYNESNSYLERYIGETSVFTSVGESVKVVYGNVYLLGTLSLVKPLNGRPIKKEYYDSSEGLVKEVSSEYHVYSGIIPTFLRYPIFFWTGNDFSSTYPYREVSYSELNKSRVQRLKKTETVEYLGESEMTSITDYDYSRSHYRATKISSTDSQGNLFITKNFFPQDVSSEPFMDNLVQENRVLPVRTETYVKYPNSSSETKLHTYERIFDNDSYTFNKTLPKQVRSFKANGSSEDNELIFERYDEVGNVLQYRKRGGAPTTLIWGYNSTYPAGKIENATFEEVATALNLTASQLMNLDESEIGQINSLRNFLPDALVTTYNYEPLVGLKSITDHKGNETTFYYDSSNRLKLVKDHNGDIVNEYSYHFKNQF